MCGYILLFTVIRKTHFLRLNVNAVPRTVPGTLGKQEIWGRDENKKDGAYRPLKRTVTSASG